MKGSGPRYPLGVHPLLRPLLGIMLLLGLCARLDAIRLNADPHGDVHLDALTLHELRAGHGFTTPLERAVLPYARIGDAPGHPADQHPPLMVLLGAAVAPLEPYLALRIVSLIFGVLLIAAVHRLLLPHAGRDGALLGAALASASFLLADFSGNGSIYTVQACLAVAALIALRGRGAASALAAGCALGLAYLTNYQALVLLPAALVVPGVPASRRVLVLAGFAAAAMPWWIRNAQVFGSPFFSVNGDYLKAWLGGEVRLVAKDGVFLQEVAAPSLLAAIKAWRGILVVNTRFVLLQTPVWLTCVVPAAALGAAIALRRGWLERKPDLVALVLFLAAQLAVTVLWPAAKFRYLVPIAPLVIALAALATREAAPRAGRVFLAIVLGVLLLVALELLFRGRPDDGLVLLVATGFAAVPLAHAQPGGGRPSLFSLAALFLVSQVVLRMPPPRTTYYDAIFAGDAFGQKGEERRDRARQAAMARVVDDLAKRGVRAVVGDIELKHHALARGFDLTVIQPPPEGPREMEVLRAALARHGAHEVAVDDAAARKRLLAAAPAAAVLFEVSDTAEKADPWSVLHFP